MPPAKYSFRIHSFFSEGRPVCKKKSFQSNLGLIQRFFKSHFGIFVPMRVKKLLLNGGKKAKKKVFSENFRVHQKILESQKGMSEFRVCLKKKHKNAQSSPKSAVWRKKKDTALKTVAQCFWLRWKNWSN